VEDLGSIVADSAVVDSVCHGLDCRGNWLSIPSKHQGDAQDKIILFHGGWSSPSLSQLQTHIGDGLVLHVVHLMGNQDNLQFGHRQKFNVVLIDWQIVEVGIRNDVWYIIL
jgi:hypothetical protein